MHVHIEMELKDYYLLNHDKNAELACYHPPKSSSSKVSSKTITLYTTLDKYGARLICNTANKSATSIIRTRWDQATTFG